MKTANCTQTQNLTSSQSSSIFDKCSFRIVLVSALMQILYMVAPSVSAQGTTYTYYFDGDGDGYGKTSSTLTSSDPTPPPGYAKFDGDCNDASAAVHPGATEVCGNGIDDNCDGQVDEGCACYVYQDLDGDGYGTTSTRTEVPCGEGIPGYVGQDGDCDDANAAVHPGATEICGNGIDDNCNGQIDTDCPCFVYQDIDGDGYGTASTAQQVPCGSGIPGYVGQAGDCDDLNPSIHPNATEICGNGIDDNCNGQIDEGCVCYVYFDGDGDGYGKTNSAQQVPCGMGIPGYVGLSGDCNDADPSVHPNAEEICGNGIDDDCDGQIDEKCPCYVYQDVDGDGYGTTSTKTEVPCGEGIPGYVGQGGDCNDGNPSIHPNATEIPGNGLDDNCDGQIDEGAGCFAYEDVDGDGYGKTSTATPVPCGTMFPGYVGQGGDCDDLNPSIHPGATEICGNGIDDNCDGQIDEGCVCYVYFDGDGDGYGKTNSAQQVPCGMGIPGYVGLSGDCNDGDPSVHPNAEEICGNGIDDDCDGQIDEKCPCYVYQDLDGDGYGTTSTKTEVPCGEGIPGYVGQGGDCNDGNPSIHPNTTEIPGNGVDDNCNGQIDEGAGCFAYEDVDGDGYGKTSTATPVPCGTMIPGYVAQGGDCDDFNPSVNPGAVEICGNGIDDNCDGQVDEGCVCYVYQDMDGDGYGNPSTATQVPCGMGIPGYVGLSGDCNDGDVSVHPNAEEICGNGIDDDCDGQIDEKCPCYVYQDLDGDGYGTTSTRTEVPCGMGIPGYVGLSGDCNDGNTTVHPGAPEICDGLDNNCNGQVDEGIGQIWYRDADGDGYGDAGKATTACSAPSGYVASNTDCDDTRAFVHPGAVEICGNGIDDNCNGRIDEKCTAVDMTINDISITERNKNTSVLTFTVSLAKASSNTVTVQYNTQNVTAIAGSDYVASSGILTFAPGIRKQTIRITINGDKIIEPNETFNVILSNAINANITKAIGVGTILNDDGKVGAVAAITLEDDRRVISVMPNPANSIAKISLEGYKGAVTIQLSNGAGKMLKQVKLVATDKVAQQQIDVSAFASGVYLITAIDDKGNRQTEKLAIAH